MSENIRYQCWVAAVAAVIFFTFLGAASLWDEDETLYASIAREMLQRNDWVVPMFNGHLFPEKPPLMFWQMIAGFEIFGQSEFGARFFSALLGVGTSLLTYHLGRLLFNSRIGLWSGLIAASSIIFTVSARAATVDSALVFVSTLALLCFAAADKIQNSGDGDQDPNSVPRLSFFGYELSISRKSLIRYGLFVLLYICLGLAILAKGPVGFLLPAMSLGLYLAIKNAREKNRDAAPSVGLGNCGVSGIFPGIAYRLKGCVGTLKVFRPMNLLRSLWQLRPLTGAAVILAVALPWYVLVGIRTDGVWLEQFFAKFNFRPFMQPILGHSGPFWVHIPFLLIGFFPWSVFIGPTMTETARRIRDRDPRRNGYILLTSWFCVFFIFWSICSTKLPHYVLPVYPVLAVLTGCLLETWIVEPARISPSWMKNAWITTMAVGVGIVAGFAIAARIYLPGDEMIGLVGAILVIGGYLCLYYSKRRQNKLTAAVFACTAAAFLTAVFGFAAPIVDRHQNAKRLAAMIREDGSETARVCAYRFFRQSMVYYAGHPVQFCDTPEQLLEFLDRSPRAYVITLDKYGDEIEQTYPHKFHILARERRFLANDEMLVFAPADGNNSLNVGQLPKSSNK